MKGEILNSLEGAITASRKDIELSDMYNRLRNNSDFKRIILDLYIRDSSLALVKAQGTPGLAAEDEKSYGLEIVAIGRLIYFLETIDVNAETARKTIEMAQEQINELDSEGEQ